MDLALSVFANSERTTSVDTDCCSAGAADLSERRRGSASGGRVHLVAPARGRAESGWHDFNRFNAFNAATRATGAMWVGRITCSKRKSLPWNPLVQVACGDPQ